MSEYGITSQGFVRKPYNVIVEELQADYRSEFGDDIDLSDYSPNGQELKLRAKSLDEIWQELESAYDSNDLDKAEDENLDRLTKLGFVGRKGEQHAVVALEFSGDPLVSVLSGSEAETASGIVFESIEDGTTDESGTISVQSKAKVAGITGNVPAGAINSIKTPVAGIDSVTNLNPATGGRGIETNAEERQRYKDLPAATGSSIAAVEAAVANIGSVISTSSYENKSNFTDANNLPAHSFEIVVVGGIGLESEIAQTIFDNGPAGIGSYGNIEVPIVDDNGVENIVKFSRPIDVNVFVEIDLLTNPSWSDEAKPLMKTEIVEYIGGSDDSGNEYDGVGTGKTVRMWKILASLEEFSGIDTITVRLGLTASPVEPNNLVFQAREKPVTDFSKIVINVT